MVTVIFLFIAPIKLLGLSMSTPPNSWVWLQHNHIFIIVGRGLAPAVLVSGEK